MKFDITKRISLAEYGDAWKECYLEFAIPSYADIKGIQATSEDNQEKAVELGIERMGGLFRSGKAVSEGQVVDVKKEDIKDLPLEILTKCFQAISGEPSPDLKNASNQ